MLELFAGAASQVILAALVLGAGLPAMFALGIRAIALADGGAAPAAKRRPALRIVGVLCLGVVAIAVILGITVIVAGGFGKELVFDQFLPVLVDKN